MADRSEALHEELARLGASGRVRLAVAASARDGLVVHAVGEDTTSAPAVAALFAALFRRARAAAAAHDFGEPRVVRVQSHNAHILAVESANMVLVLVADSDANVGRLRLELLRSAGALE